MTDKIELLENEVAVLKNEIRQVLLDIRDNLLTNYQNPFSNIDLSSLARAEDAPKVQHVTVEHLAGPGQGAAQQAAPASPAQVEGQGQVAVEQAAPASPVQVDGHGQAAAQQTAPASPAQPDGHGQDTARPAQPAPTGQSAAAEGGENVYADLAAVAALSRWLGSGVHKVGKQRMEAVVEIYAMLGGLSPGLKDVLCRLLSLDDGEGLALRDCIAMLIELDSLMWRTRAGRGDAAILSFFMHGKEESDG